MGERRSSWACDAPGRAGLSSPHHCQAPRRLAVTVTDAFFAEVVKLSPPYLSKMAFVGCSNLRSVVLSPMGACPSLNKLDLSQCSNLSFVLIQSESLDTLNLSLCGSLTKILLHCKSLANLDLREVRAEVSSVRGVNAGCSVNG